MRTLRMSLRIINTIFSIQRPDLPTNLMINTRYMLHSGFHKENPTEPISPMQIPGKHRFLKNYLIMKQHMNIKSSGLMLRGNLFYMNYIDQLILDG